MRKIPALTALALAVLAAACSGNPAAPPTAAQMEHHVPGCHRPFTPSGGVDVQARTEQECLTPYAEVFVATFASAGLERQWITAQQAGVCETVQGTRWAALVLSLVADACQSGGTVAHALGGRVVNG